jgi:hypothetical protein
MFFEMYHWKLFSKKVIEETFAACIEYSDAICTADERIATQR